MNASTDTTRKIATLRKWSTGSVFSEKSVKLDAAYLATIADEMERIYNLLIIANSTLPWRPISELVKDGEPSRYGDENGFLLLAPELIDLDCNVHGVGMGHWQDDGKLWNMDPQQLGQRDPDADYGSWLACKWSMTNDEWSHVCCTPTHYINLRGTS